MKQDFNGYDKVIRRLLKKYTEPQQVTRKNIIRAYEEFSLSVHNADTIDVFDEVGLFLSWLTEGYDVTPSAKWLEYYKFLCNYAPRTYTEGETYALLPMWDRVYFYSFLWYYIMIGGRNGCLR